MNISQYAQSIIHLTKGMEKGAELGVKWGRTTQALLSASPTLHLIGVDAMTPQPNHSTETYETWDFNEYQRCIDSLVKEFQPRFRFICDYTHNAVKNVEDNSLDFIFIDADHSYEGVKRDIEDWSPKVKKGGLIIGHDYRTNYPNHRFMGVNRAVEEAFDSFKTAPGFVWYVEK